MMVVQSDPQKRAMYVLESKRMKWAHTHTHTNQDRHKCKRIGHKCRNSRIRQLFSDLLLWPEAARMWLWLKGWQTSFSYFLSLFAHKLWIQIHKVWHSPVVITLLSIFFLPFFALPSFPFSFSVVGWFCFACVSGTHKKNVAVCVFVLCVNRYLSRKLSKQKVAIPDPNHIANAYTFSICVFFSEA